MIEYLIENYGYANAYLIGMGVYGLILTLVFVPQAVWFIKKENRG